ncbi:MAG: TonB-dependent receptor [Acidobacteria bacterium]|nr:TonB-dependent receptor [Acidobacteriota bacterium]
MSDSRISFRRLFEPAAMLVATIFICALATAQNTNGRIIGTVTDPQGAAIAGAHVIISNTGTGIQSTTTTDNSGSYQVLNLPVGLYAVTVESQGFVKATTQPQELNINQSLRVDVPLKVGAINEVVEVQSESGQVETVNPTIGGTVTGKPIQELPLNGRNTLDLGLTQPGVVPAPSTGYGTNNGGDTNNGYNGISIAGGRADAVTYLLDGGLNNAVTSNQVVFNPNPDAVAEFRILANNYTAEYGRNGGGTVTVVTKSGSNRLHGSLFEYLRNDAMNANDFIDNELGNARPTLKRNQFGGTLGGPIRKDKMFFFFGYQGQRQSQSLLGSSVTTFTPQELNGDFSHSSNGAPDANLVSFLASHPYYQSNAALAAQGIIDPSKVAPVFAAYRAANLIPTSPTGTLLPRGSSTDNVDQYMGKYDYYATASDQISITLGSNKQPVFSPFSANLGDPSVPGFPDTATTTNQFANIGYTKTISPKLVNELHITAERYHTQSIPGSHPPTPAQLGIAINSDLPYAPPIINLFDSGLNLGFNENVPRNKADNTYAVADSLSWITGKHTWKMGGRFSVLQENSVYSYATNGWFFFYGAGTGIASGNDRADFFMGLPDEYQQYPSANNNEHQTQSAAFLQNEWRVSPRLTLTLGVRYEYTSPEKDIHGHSFSIIPGDHSTRFQNAPVGLVVPGDRGAPDGWYFPDRKNFAPRFGFAWDPAGNGKTSVRGGAGMFYDTLNGWMSDWNNGVLPWWPSADLFFPAVAANLPNLSMSNPYQNACVFDANGNCSSSGQPDPFPSVPPPPSLNFASKGYLPFGFGDLFVNPHLRTPYIYQYNISVQRQLTNDTLAELGYAGSSSHKLLTWVDENPIVPGSGQRLLNMREGLNNTNGFAPLVTFDGLNNANYNGLLASLTHRTADIPYLGSVFFTFSYTWSHNLDNGSGFNQRTGQISFFEPHRFYGNSDFDIRNRVVFSGGWELPFAKMWSNASRRLTAGWTLLPIWFYQSGSPLDIYGSAGAPSENNPGPSGFGDPQNVRADQVTSSVQTFDPRRLQTFAAFNGGAPGNYYFNPSDLIQDPCIGAGTCPIGFYGTYRRNSLIGPSRTNFDLALEKTTDLVGENMKLAFRVEAFNLLNHAEFKNPASTRVTSPQLGVVSATYDPRILQVALRLTF